MGEWAGELVGKWESEKEGRVKVGKRENDDETMKAIRHHWQLECGHLETSKARALHRTIDRILGKLVNMGNNPLPWLLRKTRA